MSANIVCVGSALIDELYFCKESTLAGTSNPAILKKYTGGVISNIAQHLSLLDCKVDLLTVIGNDTDGQWISDELSSSGINIDNSLKIEDSTGKYVSILNNDGSLFTAVCFDNTAKYLTSSYLSSNSIKLKSADIIVADTNIDSESLQWLIIFSEKQDIPLIIEPVSVAKASKVATLNIDKLFMLTPNEDELYALCNKKHNNEVDAVNELLGRGVKCIWLRKGNQGSVFYTKSDAINLPAKLINIKDSTGAGDAALSAWIAGYVKNFGPLKCLQLGHTLAFEVLQINGAVKKDISFSILLESFKKYYPDAE